MMALGKKLHHVSYITYFYNMCTLYTQQQYLFLHVYIYEKNKLDIINSDMYTDIFFRKWRECLVYGGGDLVLAEHVCGKISKSPLNMGVFHLVLKVKSLRCSLFPSRNKWGPCLG